MDSTRKSVDYRFLAFDLGAESGRAVVAIIIDGKLSMEEVSRFANRPVQISNTLHWNVLDIYSQIVESLRIYRRNFGEVVDGIGIDTWGVDFGLLARDGSLLQNPVSYRDARTHGVSDRLWEKIDAMELYRRTGMTELPISTLCQLLSMRLTHSPILECATTLLMMPSLLGYFLTGRKYCERSIAVTTQMFNPTEGIWDSDLLSMIEVPNELMPEILPPGSVIGELELRVLQETGLKKAVLVAPCLHDTGSAVSAVHGEGEDWAFVSCGTWSVVGVPTKEIVTSADSFAAGLCNEIYLDGFFLCRNIVGLWLLQEVRRAWQRNGNSYSYDDLVMLAKKTPEGGPLIYPDHHAFLCPTDMLEAILNFCLKTGQIPPEDPGQITRCILESLALAYRNTLDEILSVRNRGLSVLHIIGGGSLNSLLCQLTADATGLHVVAGPTEATVVGNVLAQARALGYLVTPEERRLFVTQNVALASYIPHDGAPIRRRYPDYLKIRTSTAILSS